MNKEARENYNQSFSEEKYQQMIAEIEAEFPGQLDFRVAESPIFVPNDLKIKILSACNSIIDKIKSPDFKEKTERAIPKSHFVPNETEHPSVLAIDFGITLDENGQLSPQLIELQGFPSLFGYQSYLSSKYKKHFSVSPKFSEYFNRMNGRTYQEEMKNFLLGDSKPENVILLEIFPEKQKTRLDFAITKAYWGIEAVCITKIFEENNQLFYLKEGNKTRIERIYNRLIFDDLDRNYSDIKLNIDLSKPYDVTWISHPNWFYRVSKYCLPLFKSPYIPFSKYLSDFEEYPNDLENYVLKPLFSFAGAGVNIDIQKEDLETIKDPENYILQQKVKYEPCITDTKGEGIKCEIRMLYIWPENAKNPKLVTNLARLSKGKMIGVDFNKDFDWVGGSGAFFETN